MALCKSTIPYLEYNAGAPMYTYMNVNFPHISQLSLSNPISSSLDLLYLITVTDIQCTFSTGGSGLRDSVSALLRKPEGFPRRAAVRGRPSYGPSRRRRLPDTAGTWRPNWTPVQTPNNWLHEMWSFEKKCEFPWISQVGSKRAVTVENFVLGAQTT